MGLLAQVAAFASCRLSGRAAAISLASCLTVGLLLTACGGAAESGASTATVPAATVIGSPATPATAPAIVGAAGTPAPLTLGELFDRIHAAWAGEQRFREITSFQTTGESGQPGSPRPPQTGRTIREVYGPQQVRAAAEENGQLVYEVIVNGEVVFLRGTIATLFDPSLPAGEWVQTNVRAVAAQPQLGEQMLRPILLSTPGYKPPDRLRPQVVRELAADAGEGCTAYGAADTTSTGARIDLTIAVDQTGGLCRIETRSPGLASTYLVEPLAATAELPLPEDARIDGSPAAALGASPVASPLPTDWAPFATKPATQHRAGSWVPSSAWACRDRGLAVGQAGRASSESAAAAMGARASAYD